MLTAVSYLPDLAEISRLKRIPVAHPFGQDFHGKKDHQGKVDDPKLLILSSDCFS